MGMQETLEKLRKLREKKKGKSNAPHTTPDPRKLLREMGERLAEGYPSGGLARMPKAFQDRLQTREEAYSRAIKERGDCETAIRETIFINSMSRFF